MPRMTYAESARERAAVEVCEGCIMAAEDDGAEDEIAEIVCREYGSDIADHICEAREEGEPCGCACREYDAGGPRS